MTARSLCLAAAAAATSLVGAGLGVPAAAHAQGRPTAAAIAAGIDSLADSLTRGPVVGMSVVVARGPEVLLAKGYGMADREAQRPVTAQTVYQIGSVTKQFTAAAIMRLVEQGQLALSDPVTRFLPDFPAQGRAVTIQQLLNHTSGIRSYTSFLPLGDSLSVAQIYDSIKVQPFDFEPGSDYRYNNSGYLLLGLILERVTGVEYPALMKEWFFTPLGLADTRYCGTDGLAPPSGYRPGLMDARTRVAPTDMRIPFAAGAICSTAPDLARWTWALANGRVVKPESFAAMSGGSVLSTGRRIGYGYGLAADTVHGRALIHHGGGIPGFVSEAGFFPGDSTIVVVLLNTEASMRGIAERVQEVALGVERETVSNLPVNTAEIARVSGTYSLGDGRMELRIFPENDKLMSQATGQPVYQILWQGGAEYRPTFDTRVKLVFDNGSPAPGLTIYQGGMTMKGHRKAE